MNHLIALVPNATTFTIIILIFVFFKLFKKIPTINPPPSPPRLPIVGNLHQLGSMPHRSLQALSQKYGDVMLLHFGGVPTVVFSSAETARDALKTHDLAFASRPFSSVAKRLAYDCTTVGFAPYGEYWRQARRICVLQLLSVKRVQLFRSVRAEEVSLFIEKIRESSGAGPVNLAAMITNLTNNIVCRVAFGSKKHFGGGRGFGEILEEYLHLLGSFPLRDFIPWLGWIDSLSGLDARVMRNHMDIDCFLDKVFDEHLICKDEGGDGDDGDDFVDVLLSLEENDDMVGVSISRDNMKAIVLDMFEAGTHTIFSVTEWAMAELIKNPTMMKKAQEEVRKFSECEGEITEESIGRMQYLKAVIKETLRLHPPVPLLVPHETTQDVRMQGYDIRARTRVLVNVWAIGRDPRSWERPEEFSPERFMDRDIDFRGQDFQFIPFGAGRRGCPGIEFAVPTLELALAHLLHRFDWELPDGMRGEELDMSESYGISVHKRSSLVLVAKPRL